MKRLVRILLIMNATVGIACGQYYISWNGCGIDIEANGNLAHYWFDAGFDGHEFGVVTSLSIQSVDAEYSTGMIMDRDGGAFYYSVSDGGPANEVIWNQSVTPQMYYYLYSGVWSGAVDLLGFDYAPGQTYTLTLSAKSWGSYYGDSWFDRGDGTYTATFATPDRAYLRGAMNDWGATAMAADYSFGNMLALTFSNSYQGTANFKYDRDGDWDPQWGFGTDSQNAARNSTIGQVRGSMSGESPGDMSIAMDSGKVYTWRMNGISTWWNRQFVVMETDNWPVNVIHVSEDSSTAGTNPVRVDIQLSASKSAQERIFVRYSTDGGSSFTVSDEASGSGTSYVASIPGQPNGSTVNFYVLTSTMPKALIEASADLCTLRGNNNGNLNYNYTVAEYAYTTNTPVAVPISWLQTYYPASNDYETVAMSDTDGDSMAAWQEYVANTIPTDGTSYFKAEGIVVDTNGQDLPKYEVRVNTQPGREYTIWFTDGILSNESRFSEFYAGGQWIETNAAASSHTFIDDGTTNTSGGIPSSGMRYYRLEVGM